jgi:tetratricopeptide (TPR) repeat protein
MDSIQTNGSMAIIRKYFFILIFFISIIAFAEIYQSYIIFKSSKFRTSSYDRVQELVQKGNCEDLLDYSEKTLQNNPNDPNALYGKAEALYQLKRWKEAEEAFMRVKEQVPSWSSYADKYLKNIRTKLDRGFDLEQ